MPDKDLTHRTPAEELWLNRMRAGLSQTAYAARLGVSRNTLANAERNGPSNRLRAAAARKTTATTPLLLALARRRHGLSLRATAVLVGTSHTTLLDWEVRGAVTLVSWWERRGWHFGAQRALK